jgi:hypothetical protein
VNRPVEIIEKALSIVQQLPATSPDIGLGQPPSKDYFISPLDNTSTVSASASSGTWDDLVVVRFVDTIFLRILLQLVQLEIGDELPGIPIMRRLNATVFLLRVSLDYAATEPRTDRAWTVVCAFLWTSWQRILMLELRQNARRQLKGYSFDRSHTASIRTLDTIPEVIEYRRKIQEEELRATPYLCSWAYRNLIHDAACISTDVRRFHQLYHAHFGSRPAACNAGPVQCRGQSSLACRRFEQTEVTNQSMHAPKCSRSCKRLFWSRESFLSVRGPKAIDIEATTDEQLRYCLSTETTLTISHVWSHGQGGRPDSCGSEGTGFNSCLHQRYSRIAASLGCSSYWMDTPCIPSEKTLRRECIANITRIFTTSNVTLICDRDLMSIDVSKKNIESLELLLCTLLVCDWNMRAWTLLESMRGRHSLYILCFYDEVVSLHETLRAIFSSGRLDIAVLFMTRPYLLPPERLDDISLFDDPEPFLPPDELERSRFATVAAAAVLLSSRHATRDDDDLVVWNLLIGDTEPRTAEEMWRSLVGQRIPTGSLISSAPRLKGVSGFRWAPARPTTLRRTAVVREDVETFPAFDGVDTKNGFITAEGLRGSWWTFRFPVRPSPEHSVTFSDTRVANENSHQSLLLHIAEHFLNGYSFGILLQPLHARGPATTPVPYQGSSDHIFVVCGSKDGRGWEWQGLYKWSRHEQLPKFGHEEILLV